MKKFKNAFEGLKLAISHKAVRVQIILGICAIIGGLIIRLDYYEWLTFVICIGLVISFEIMNTVIEKIGDYLNIEKDEKIKVIKDMSSAGVLVSSFMSLVICILCILRRVL